MIGIYKITAPNKKVYIGQSINIEKRICSYKKLQNIKEQTLLKESFFKYGTENHIFEIICECEFTELNYIERYYQELFQCVGKNGLNCVLAPNKVKVKQQENWWIRTNSDKSKYKNEKN